MIVTTNELLDELRQAAAARGVAEGFSSEELREELGWGILKSRRVLKRLVNEGRVVNVPIVRTTMAGYERTTIGYKFVDV
jgi:hypothetical protein